MEENQEKKTSQIEYPAIEKKGWSLSGLSEIQTLFVSWLFSPRAAARRLYEDSDNTSIIEAVVILLAGFVIYAWGGSLALYDCKGTGGVPAQCNMIGTSIVILYLLPMLLMFVCCGCLLASVSSEELKEGSVPRILSVFPVWYTGQSYLGVLIAEYGFENATWSNQYVIGILPFIPVIFAAAEVYKIEVSKAARIIFIVAVVIRGVLYWGLSMI